MDIINQIKAATLQVLSTNYQFLPENGDISINETKSEFEGDYTVVLFSFVKTLRRSPEVLGKELGEALIRDFPLLVAGFNVIKGFLNLTIADSRWLGFLAEAADEPDFGYRPSNGKKVMIEYSSPNTNKPLHLGHLRNNFLGWSVAEISKANGYEVVKTCIANDRGIHICKSMVSWKWFAAGATPADTGTKGDHFVGDYYVLFNEQFKKEVDRLVADGMSKEEAEKEAPIMKEAQQMLVDWEAGKPDVIELWRTMNSWVYAGFDATYARIGSDFDRIYYESDTYLLGKKLVETGLQKGVFFKKDDGSVWIDLCADGLDQKIVQRRDGTAVYMTQDIGLAVQRYDEFHADRSVYVVGDEQNYHFKVLKLICQKLGLPSARRHISPKLWDGGIADGPDENPGGHSGGCGCHPRRNARGSGAQDDRQGKTEGFSDAGLDALYETIGLGGLKFFLLRVDPKKRMLFNPDEFIDLHGYTATFIQYAYARIRSIFRKEGSSPMIGPIGNALLPLEKALIVTLEKYPSIVAQAGEELSPSLIAAYAFQVAQAFNSFYNVHSIASAETSEKKSLRLKLSLLTSKVLESSMRLLGINMPERM